ncbi:MAG: vanadium-dependent haloperoxidase, partial [Anaerolineae bacterium]|nr:vanadium-dependent haloperoxidase [Anaerolineae bacterium]
MNRRMHLRRFSLLEVLALLLLAFAGVHAQSEMVAPDAGSWHTWLIESGEALRLDAPNDPTSELEMVQAMLAEVNPEIRDQIRYWSAGSPAYRWNELTLDQLETLAVGAPVAGRMLALVNVAIHDATIAAWDTKYAYNRPRPSELDSSLQPVLDTPASPSYPSEHAVAAGAASEVLAFLFEPRADYYRAQAEASANAMLHSGIYYPSDIEAGLELGRNVAAQVIAYAQNDNFSTATVDEIHGEEGQWSATNPILPELGDARPWVLESADEFRPAPPPANGSPEMEAEMDELRAFEHDPRTDAIVRFWEYGAGGRHAYLYHWNVMQKLMFEFGVEDNPPLATSIYSSVSVSQYDAYIATWDAKYFYLRIRPFQYDPEFTTVIPTPNHPSYPSAHSVSSMAVYAALAQWFPSRSDDLMNIVSIISESRFWGGIHYRSD